METLRCPTCSSMLLVLDAGERRCPMCRTQFGLRSQPIVLGPDSRNDVAFTSTPEHALTPADGDAGTDAAARPRRFRRFSRRSAQPTGEWVFASALHEPMLFDQPDMVPGTTAVIARPVTATPPPDPEVGRARWRDMRLRWVDAEPETDTDIDVVETIEIVSAPAPAKPASAARAVEPEVVSATASPTPPAPEPREPNPMWRDRVFLGAPAEVQHQSVTWPRRRGD